MAITLTEKAAKHINRYIERRGKGVGLRFGVRTTGCSGLAYKLEYVDEVTVEDNVFESHGVKVFVDPKSLDDGLERTAQRQKGNDAHNGFGWILFGVKECSLSRSECLLARSTAPSLAQSIMHTQIVLTLLSS